MIASEPDLSLLNGRTVLVVEDEFLIAEEICAFVERLGGVVMGPISRVPAALAALETRTPDLALLDVNVRGQLVYPVAELLQVRGTPFALLTGYDRSTIDTRFVDAPFVEKPAAQPALIRAIKRCLPD
jgi:two-component SAPR family response regulator